MAETTVIGDVRTAKAWLDQQSSDWQEVRDRLRAIERSYQGRTGLYGAVPNCPPDAVKSAIANAQDEPGHTLLSETRPARPT